jgi:hypothetical protein
MIDSNRDGKQPTGLKGNSLLDKLLDCPNYCSKPYARSFRVVRMWVVTATDGTSSLLVPTSTI